MIKKVIVSTLILTAAALLGACAKTEVPAAAPAAEMAPTAEAPAATPAQDAMAAPATDAAGTAPPATSGDQSQGGGEKLNP